MGGARRDILESSAERSICRVLAACRECRLKVVADLLHMAKHGKAAGERREALYSGHVQGVGFRYTVRQIAAEYAVTGFVRNLADGRVELVAEGSPAELDAFMAAVAQQMADHLRSIAVDVRPGLGEFESFEIRH